jgi:argininosuccinate synthase
MTDMAMRVALAYSGGLDTSIAVRWMAEHYNAEIIAVAVDLGQDKGPVNAAALVQRARAVGAIHAEVVDARDEFAEQYIAPALRANALYEGSYPLISALSRPAISRHLVDAARRNNADAVAHGCTGKGNDQVRFEVSLRTLAPELQILAPVREWDMTRAQSLEYAQCRGIPLSDEPNPLFSTDQNLWGRTIACGELEDPWRTPPESVWQLTVSTAHEPQDLIISFEEGVPIAVDAQPMSLAALIEHVGEVVGSHGWGRVDVVENRRVGIKNRDVYECPSALALILAHRALESICLERDLGRLKQRLEIDYAELVYDGLWFSPLREALAAFFDSSQRHVTGDVRLSLSSGRCEITGRRSPYSLYDTRLATYETGNIFPVELAAGFVRLWGLSAENWSRIQAQRKSK